MCDLWCPFPVLSLQKNKSITHIHLWQSDIQKHETWCYHCSKIHLIDVNLMPGNHIMTFNMNNYTYIITSNYYYYQSRTSPAFYLLYFLSTQKEFFSPLYEKCYTNTAFFALSGSIVNERKHSLDVCTFRSMPYALMKVEQLSFCIMENTALKYSLCSEREPSGLTFLKKFKTKTAEIPFSEQKIWLFWKALYLKTLSLPLTFIQQGAEEVFEKYRLLYLNREDPNNNLFLTERINPDPECDLSLMLSSYNYFFFPFQWMHRLMGYSRDSVEFSAFDWVLTLRPNSLLQCSNIFKECAH